MSPVVGIKWPGDGSNCASVRLAQPLAVGPDEEILIAWGPFGPALGVVNAGPGLAAVLGGVAGLQVVQWPLGTSLFDAAPFMAEDVTGPYDVIVRAEARNVDELGKLVVARIQAVAGITRTLTCPVVHL